MRALISVSDRSGAVGLAGRLVALGWEIISSGGTAAALRGGGVAVREVADVTGAPEMLDGRVKTLHPAVHGGILADRSKPEHLADLAAAGAEPIDLVVCNLYPFGSAPSVEMIDIGGPAMLRAAAKNHAHVGVVVDPADYEAVLAELEAAGTLGAALRRRLARKAFAHCSAYDAAVVAWLDTGAPEGVAGGTANDPSPGNPSRRGWASGPRRTPRTDRRPGRCPSRWCSAWSGPRCCATARTRIRPAPATGGPTPRVGGTPPRSSAASSCRTSTCTTPTPPGAWRTTSALTRPAVVVKHANPCGAAAHDDIAEAYRRAHACDPTSAFGGVVAFNRPVTEEVAASLAEVFTEVIVAPGYDPAALESLRTRRNLRILRAAAPRVPGAARALGGGVVPGADRPVSHRCGTRPNRPLARCSRPEPRARRSIRRTTGPGHAVAPAGWEVVTDRRLTEDEWRDLVFAWRVAAAVSSNAIVVARDRCAVGIGAGQQNRRDAGRIAAAKAGDRGRGGAYASDAFLPFADGLDGAVEGGLHGRCPAGRLGARRRGHRGRRPPRPGHGPHRPPHLPPLTPRTGSSNPRHGRGRRARRAP